MSSPAEGGGPPAPGAPAPGPAGAPRRPNALLLLAGIVLAALAVSRLAGSAAGWVSSVGTAAHEAGHAAVADVLTGDVTSITVFRDGGGVALTSPSDSRWRAFLVAGAGYPATLVAGLALLSAALFARSCRLAAGLGSSASLVALVLWTPVSAAVPVIEDGDQRFTVVVLVTCAVVLGATALLPGRSETARRVVLGAFAVGLLADAFQAGEDLVLAERQAGRVMSDADLLAAASGVLDAGTWAWLVRALLFVVAVGWAAVAVRRLQPPSGA